jgi:hypothetical protein
MQSSLDSDEKKAVKKVTIAPTAFNPLGLQSDVSKLQSSFETLENQQLQLQTNARIEAEQIRTATQAVTSHDRRLKELEFVLF